ncbi:hypothetical protein F3Y22_tig00000764pilonHSYRG00265 [Hibiscus syriacus]|uniref:t-SNARE coiled-coil homology domain-containing protein n=1 Tax=Hibiscus syriacus TaxID=106335 RepID=A0A6A3D5M4_HIBSY|nr:hypothetical protein F3Y22_tig00000764pilonHSYRG00265 [Hibiscus syriacus]
MNMPWSKTFHTNFPSLCYCNWLQEPFLCDPYSSKKMCRQEVLLLDNEIGFNEAMIDEREQGIREIEEQIGQVNDIFKDLAVLVHDQGVVIGKMPNTP